MARPCPVPASTHGNAQRPHRGGGRAPLELLLSFKGKPELPEQERGEPQRGSWCASTPVAPAQTPLRAGTEGPVPQRPFLGHGEGQSRVPAVAQQQLCGGHGRRHAAAPALTHVAIGDLCRAQAVRDALGAAGGAVPCKDKDKDKDGTGRQSGPRRRGGEGRCVAAALTEGAIAIAVVGRMAQEGVRDAAAVPCKRVPMRLQQLPWCCAAHSQGGNRGCTYPVEMLGVPGKRGRKETDLVRCPSPRAVEPSPRMSLSPSHWDLSPGAQQGLGGSGEPLQGLCHGLEMAK